MCIENKTLISLKKTSIRARIILLGNKSERGTTRKCRVVLQPCHACRDARSAAISIVVGLCPVIQAMHSSKECCQHRLISQFVKSTHRYTKTFSLRGKFHQPTDFFFFFYISFSYRSILKKTLHRYLHQAIHATKLLIK